MRKDNRDNNQIRKVKITKDYLFNPEGSALIEIGNTRVICAATLEEGVPSFCENEQQGWITAEYGMLPRSTDQRMRREASSGKQGGRTMEIQRLIGRALRAAVDLEQLYGWTIKIDCDVIDADGGTRCASISGAFVALIGALKVLSYRMETNFRPLKNYIAAISLGIVDNEMMLDLAYDEDSRADVDMNVVMNDSGQFIEVQLTGERKTVSSKQITQLLELAADGCKQLFPIQRKAVQDDIQACGLI